MNLRTFIIIISFLFGCRQSTKQNIHPDRTDTVICKVIFLDDHYTEYLKAIKADYLNRNKIYKEKIQSPIINTHFLKSEYSELVNYNFSRPIFDTSGLSQTISKIKINGNQIERLVLNAFKKCNQYLKNDSLIFYVLPSNADFNEIIKTMGGVTGSTAGSKQILLFINPNINSWKEVLEYCIAHEFNHAYWTNNNFNNKYKWTLLKYLIFEGKADSFAHLLYPKVKAPWTSSLAKKEKIDLWNKIKPDLQNGNNLLLGSVMFGSGNYPKWGGYTLGFDILQTAFKNHPELAQTNWTNLKADTLLKMSDYK